MECPRWNVVFNMKNCPLQQEHGSIYRINDAYASFKLGGLAVENEQNRVEVEIYGVRYTLKGDAPPETMVGMSRDVDEKMRVVLQRNPKLSLYKAAILTALNLAEELHMLREEYDNLVKMLEPQRKKKNK